MIESGENAAQTDRADLEIALAFVLEHLGREASPAERANAERFLSHLTRQVSGRLAEESRALRAQGEQTWRHSRQARRRRALERPTRETKMEFVGRLFDAGAIGDLDLIADLVPENVEWRPLATGRTQDSVRWKPPGVLERYAARRERAADVLLTR